MQFIQIVVNRNESRQFLLVTEQFADGASPDQAGLRLKIVPSGRFIGRIDVFQFFSKFLETGIFREALVQQFDNGLCRADAFTLIVKQQVVPLLLQSITVSSSSQGFAIIQKKLGGMLFEMA